MGVHNNRRPNALKHAGYSATSILPGESAAELEKLHQALIAEFRPNGALEQETVASLAHLLWRKKNLVTFRMAQRAQQRVIEIEEEIINSRILFRRYPLDLATPIASPKASALQRRKRVRNCETCTLSSRWGKRPPYLVC